jgi:hypothetical protein
MSSRTRSRARSHRSRPPFQEPLEPARQNTLHWWINNHRRYFDKIQIATRKKMMYYGGFALNLTLGAANGGPPDGADDMYYYTRGKDIIGEEASDIDIKIMDVDTDKIYETAAQVLQAIRIFSGHPAAGIVAYDIFGDLNIHRVALESTKNKPYVIVETRPQMLQRSGLKYIIAHIHEYLDKDDRITKWQVIVTGILNNNTPQVLSEITFTNEVARLPPGVPNVPGIYGTYNISELCTQFIRKFDDIKHKDDRPVILKTLKRIAHCIVYQLETRGKIPLGQHSFLVEILGQGGNPVNEKYGSYMKAAVDKSVYDIIKSYLMEKGVRVHKGGRRQRKSVKARRASFKDNRRGNGRRSSRRSRSSSSRR